MEKKKISNTKDLQDLQRFFKKREEKEKEAIKPKQMTDEEISSFYKNNVLTAFKTLKSTLSEYNLDTIDYNFHVKVATFKIAEPLYQFFFKVEIDNSSREIYIYPIYKYRTSPRNKLIDVKLQDSERISLNEIEIISEKKIIALFTKWFLNKDEQREADVRP